MKLLQGSTVVSLALIGLSLSSPFQSEAALTRLEARSGCDQGDCPDNNFGLDLEGVRKGTGWQYYIRWKGGCGCSWVRSSEDGCGSVDICSGNHQVCLDWRRGRGHWINPMGHRTCYALNSGYVCPDRNLWEAWPTKEVPCNW
ncbi:hypothetical protein IF1G_09069 [Cordyceps javanica]|uniref:Secreted protein n=1 Tax=Cordyceps javanica TaxID=43265 RepID=A0A545USW9_9HYPO|nr:hypothetical protein IF1G_09069 [Cordyceps javanica]